MFFNSFYKLFCTITIVLLCPYFSYSRYVLYTSDLSSDLVMGSFHEFVNKIDTTRSLNDFEKAILDFIELEKRRPGNGQYSVNETLQHLEHILKERIFWIEKNYTYYPDLLSNTAMWVLGSVVMTLLTVGVYKFCYVSAKEKQNCIKEYLKPLEIEIVSGKEHGYKSYYNNVYVDKVFLCKKKKYSEKEWLHIQNLRSDYTKAINMQYDSGGWVFAMTCMSIVLYLDTVKSLKQLLQNNPVKRCQDFLLHYESLLCFIENLQIVEK